MYLHVVPYIQDLYRLLPMENHSITQMLVLRVILHVCEGVLSIPHYVKDDGK